MSIPPKDAAAAGPYACAGVLCYPGREPAPAIVRMQPRDRRARIARALRTLAACWGLAIAAVFVPVLHFVLVPSLLVAGPLLSLQKLGEAQSMLSAAGACPACGAPQEFPLARPWRARVSLRCTACGRAIALETPAPTPL